MSIKAAGFPACDDAAVSVVVVFAVPHRIDPTRPFWQTGFRPFFLLSAAFAVVAMILWAGALAGDIPVLGVTWHMHEMVFGYGGGVLAGFLLTAARRWSGRPTASGPLLALLALVWVAARVVAGFGVPGAVDALLAAIFWGGLAAALGRALIPAGSRRNYGILAAVLVMGLLDIGFWVCRGDPRPLVLGGLDLLVLFVVIVGGRVIPMFTANATGARVRRRDVSDGVTLALVTAVVLLQLFAAGSPVLGVAAALAAVATLWRMRGWGTRRALRVPLLAILHAGYALVAIGLALEAASLLAGGPAWSIAVHVLAVGVVGMMTLGMMARVTRGHTGRPLRAGRMTVAAFALLGFSLAARVAIPAIAPSATRAGWLLAALFWTLAFAVYLAEYGRSLFAPRVDGKPG